MYRFLLLIILLVGTYAKPQAQTPVEEMIDSLSIATRAGQRIDLARRIAYQLKDQDWSRAITYLQIAIEAGEKSKQYEAELAQAYYTAGLMYNERDVIDVSLDYYQKAYALYRKLNNDEKRVRLENNLAIIYARMENRSEAARYFQRVYDFQKEKGDTLHLAQVLNNMGTLFLRANPDSAIFFYRQALPIARSLGDTTLLVYLYTNLGRAHMYQNDTLGRQWFQHALAMLTPGVAPNDQAFVYGSFADYNFKNQAYDSAAFYARKVLRAEKGDPITFLAQNAAKTLYESHLKLGDFKAASTAFLRYDSIRDSLNLIEKAVNVEKIKLGQDYHVRTEQMKLAQEKSRFRFYIIGLILLIGILVLILIIIRFRNRIAKNKLENNLLEARQRELKHNLELKNQEMISRAMADMQHADLIATLISDLKALKLNLQKKANQHIVDQLINRLKHSISDDTWQEFELSFQQVHKSFYSNLSARHPELTPRDRRLCALLYLDLSTKEISRLTGQSFKSIENARTRLRKKLNLTNEKVNLSTYLVSLE